MRPRGALAIAAIGILSACGGDGAGSPEAPATPAADTEVATAPADEDGIRPLTVRQVEVFFPSATGTGLVAESREIFMTASPGDRAKQILSDLMSGPERDAALPAIPRGIRLRQVYVLDDGTAYADFTGDLATRLGGGSSDEILTVFSVVNSLVLNISEITQVGILLDGQECETLNGHLDLRRPISANLDLVQDPGAYRGSAP